MVPLDTALKPGRRARASLPWPRGLFARYALSLVAPVVLILTINGFVEGYIIYRDALGRLSHANREAVRLAADRAQQIIADLERQASFVTRAGATHPEERRRDLIALLKTQPSVQAALLLDQTGGRRLSVSRDGSDTGAPPSGERRGITFALSQTEGNRVFWMLMPHAGRDADVTALRLDPDLLFASLAQVPRPGESGLALRDRQGQTIWRTGTSDVPASPPRTLKDAMPLVAPNWTAAIETGTGEARRAVQAFALRFIWLLVFGSTLALMVSMLLSRRMIEPIAALHQGARRLADGDFNHRILPKGGDELEDLARQFNRMATQLGTSYARLEQEVATRTVDLARSVRDLEHLEAGGRAMAESLERRAVVAAIVAGAMRLTKAAAAALYVARGASGYPLAGSQGFDAGDEPTPALPAPAVRAIEGAAGPVRVEAADGTSPFAGLIATRPACRVAVAAGLLLGSETEAVLVLFFDEASPEITGALQTFVHHAALALRNARLFEDLTAQQRELASWNETLETRVAEQMTTLDRLGRLERFLAPHVASLVARGEDAERLLASHRRDVTIVFCDLRGFTAFTDGAEPEDVMGVLQAYHEVVGDTVFQHEGVIEHFAGDGIMIMFNDPVPCPEHALRAVTMALALRAKIAALITGWAAHGYDLGLGIGIAVGYATLGQVGFERRREYTAIGSVTNLAARLCDEARPGQIVVSRALFGRVEAQVTGQPLGTLNLKGFARAVPAYEIDGLRAIPGDAETSP